MSRGAIATLSIRLRELEAAVINTLCYAVGIVRFARMTAVQGYTLQDLVRLLRVMPKRMLLPLRRGPGDETSFRGMLELEVERPDASKLGLRLLTVTRDASPQLRDTIGKLMCEERIARAVAKTASLTDVLNISAYIGRYHGPFFRAVASAVPRVELARRRRAATDMAIRVVNGLRSPAVQEFFTGEEGTNAAVVVLKQIGNPYWVTQILRAFPATVRDAQSLPIRASASTFQRCSDQEPLPRPQVSSAILGSRSCATSTRRERLCGPVSPKRTGAISVTACACWTWPARRWRTSAGPSSGSAWTIWTPLARAPTGSRRQTALRFYGLCAPTIATA